MLRRHAVAPELAVPSLQRNDEAIDVPPMSEVPGAADPASFWPDALSHRARPYDAGGEHITVAEISQTPIRGLKGCIKSTVALVPVADVDELLSATAGAGWEVDAHGPLPIVDEDGPPHRSGFWVGGLRREDRYEPLVNAWRGSDTDVLVPDNNLLMVFGLVPRRTGEFQMSWDDPHGPVYDVVRATMVSDHQLPEEQRQRAMVEIRRDYLLGYCWIKKAAAVAFYYEQRWSQGDPAFSQAMAGRDSEDFNLPGRLLNLQASRDGDNGELRQFSQVWGRQLVLPRGEKRVIDVDDPELTWPGHEGPMTLQRASQKHLMGYVRDEVLRDYQRRPVFQIHPHTGGVSYRGQWSVDFCHRIGRDHIALELKKLYEGNPPAVIEHWHRYAVHEAAAHADRDAHGNRNIADRAEGLVRAYLRLTSTLAQLGDDLGLSFSQVDVGGYDTAAVDYQGWWTVDEFSRLSDVAALNMTLSDFLDRTVEVVVVLESLREAPLRNIVVKAGIEKKKLSEFRTLKLLGTLSQLATICKQSGHNWPADVSHVVSGWDKDLRVPAMRRLFSLNQLRQKGSHRNETGFAASLTGDLKAFGIDPGNQAAGWGMAVDVLYDGLIDDLNTLSDLFAEGTGIKA